MKIAAATLCALLAAPCAFAQSEDALNEFFIGLIKYSISSK